MSRLLSALCPSRPDPLVSPQRVGFGSQARFGPLTGLQDEAAGSISRLDWFLLCYCHRSDK